jgi:hypothetical protein
MSSIFNSNQIGDESSLVIAYKQKPRQKGSVNYINSQNGIDTDAVTAAQAAYYAAIPPA